MLTLRNLSIATVGTAIAMALVGIAAAALPLRAQVENASLCQFDFPGCTQSACQTNYCDVYSPGSTGFCQGLGNRCCNCYF